MQAIYLDHAATAFPKAPGVGRAMCACVETVGANIGRSGSRDARAAAETALSVREKLCALFGAEDAAACVLGSGATWAVNQAITGLRPGDRVLVGPLEHNAVMRPLRRQMERGVLVERLKFGGGGCVDAARAREAIVPGVRMVVLQHASNVCGTIQPLKEIGALCRAARCALVVDAAQSAGHIPFDMRAVGADAVAVPAHKGLLGPEGIGALLMTRAFAAALTPLMTGGTGSASDELRQIEFLPDKFEAGTLNLPGIYGWDCALTYIASLSVEKIREAEVKKCARLLQGLQTVPGARIPGILDARMRTGVVSVDFPDRDAASIADALEREYGVITRCGLHCAPCAHRALGTFPRGTIRFSIGHQTTAQEIDAAVSALSRIVRG